MVERIPSLDIVSGGFRGKHDVVVSEQLGEGRSHVRSTTINITAMRVLVRVAFPPGGAARVAQAGMAGLEAGKSWGETRGCGKYLGLEGSGREIFEIKTRLTEIFRELFA